MTQTKTNRTSSKTTSFKPNLIITIRPHDNGCHSCRVTLDTKEIDFSTHDSRSDAENSIIQTCETLGLDEQSLQQIEAYLEAHYNLTQAADASSNTTLRLFFRP